MEIKNQKEKSICSICQKEIDVQVHPRAGEVIWTHGHNAQPINNGRCCSKCNNAVVIPARMNMMGNRRS